MGRATEKVQRAVAHAFDKARKHQRSTDRPWGFFVLALVVATAIPLWLRRNDPKIINYATDLIPGVLTILIAFIPDLRKQHIVWRITIVFVGLLWSALLWKKEELADLAQRDAINKTITEANKHSDEHSDQQAANLKGALTTHSDEQIATVKKKLETTTSSVLEAFSKTAVSLNHRIEEMKPASPKAPVITFSFFAPNLTNAEVVEGKKFPVLIKSVKPNDDDVVDVPFTFHNGPEAMAHALEIWVELCTQCAFSKEVSGFEKISGMSEQMRHRIIGDFHAGVTYESTTVSIKFDPKITTFDVAFSYACDNCAMPDDTRQTLKVLALR